VTLAAQSDLSQIVRGRASLHRRLVRRASPASLMQIALPSIARAVRHHCRHHCASRIMVQASVIAGVGCDYPFTPLSFAHRDFRESPTSHCSDVCIKYLESAFGCDRIPASCPRRNSARRRFFGIPNICDQTADACSRRQAANRSASMLA
jgi:hypothetical protein